MTTTLMPIDLDSEQLAARIDTLIAEERLHTVDLLAHLAELDRRQLYAPLGHSSFFAYCTDHLRLASSSAYRRTTGARLLAKFPVVAEYLRDGRVCLTTLCMLKNVLTPENHAEILAQAAGRTEKQVERLIATLLPQPPRRDVIVTRQVTAGPAVPAAPPSPSPATATAAPAVTPQRQAIFEALSATETRMHITVGETFMTQLAQVKSALGHSLPGATHEQLLAECMRVALEMWGRRKHGAGKPRQDAATDSTGRYLTAAVRGTVWERDGGRCAFVATSGKRCDATDALEFHHATPYAKGGANTVDNVGLRCRMHNLYEAKRDYDETHMARFRRTK